MPTPHLASERARWLAELSQALGEAQRLLARLEEPIGSGSLAQELHLRIQAACLEVEALRLSRSVQREKPSYPEWIKSPIWMSAAPDSLDSLG